MKEIENIINKIDGGSNAREGRRLYELAKNCTGKGVIVEIGSWKGKSTIWLAKGSEAGKKIKVYAVDPFKETSMHKAFKRKSTLKDFKNNIKQAGVDKTVIPLVKTSEDAAKNFKKKIELVFIDGAHDYNSVKLDFKLWCPKVVRNGIMAFHDTNSPEVNKAVKEDVYLSNCFKNISFIDSLTIAEKVERNSFFDRLRNKYVLLLLNAYSFFRRLKLPQPIRELGKMLFR